MLNLMDSNVRDFYYHTDGSFDLVALLPRISFLQLDFDFAFDKFSPWINVIARASSEDDKFRLIRK